MTNNDNQTAVPFSPHASAPELEERDLEEITGTGGIGDALRKVACCVAPRTTSPVRERPATSDIPVVGAPATPQHHAQILDDRNTLALQSPNIQITEARVGASGDITYGMRQRTT